MTEHKTGTREEWLAARLELLVRKKEHTRLGDEISRHRQELPWVRIAEEYHFETDAGTRTLAKLQAYKRRMGWSFAWASSFGSDFNYDFGVSHTEEQCQSGVVDYNFRAWTVPQASEQTPWLNELGSSVGTDWPTYRQEGPGMSAFALEDGIVYHSYSTYERGVDAILGHVSVAGPRAARPQRGRDLVPPPRRIRPPVQRRERNGAGRTALWRQKGWRS